MWRGVWGSNGSGKADDGVAPQGTDRKHHRSIFHCVQRYKDWIHHQGIRLGVLTNFHDTAIRPVFVRT
jgi:hypothetical protein